MSDSGERNADGQPRPFKFANFSRIQSRALLESKGWMTPENVSSTRNGGSSAALASSVSPAQDTVPRGPEQVSVASLFGSASRKGATVGLLQPKIRFTRNEYPSCDEITHTSSSPSPEAAYMHSNHSTMVPAGDKRSQKTSAFHATPTNPQSLPSHADLGSGIHDEELLVGVWRGMRKREEDVERLQNLNSHISHDLADTQAKYEKAARDSDAKESELERMRVVLGKVKEELASSRSEVKILEPLVSQVKHELSACRDERDRLRAELGVAKGNEEKLTNILGKSKARISQLSEAQMDFGNTFRELKQAYDASQDRVRKMTLEFEDFRKLAKEGLDALELVNDANELGHAFETKATLKELQEALLSSNQVTDILRDKLLGHTTELIQARARIDDLELEKRGSLNELLGAREEEKRHFELLVIVEKQVVDLSHRLSVREQETMDVMQESASLERSMKAAVAELDGYKMLCDSQKAQVDGSVSKLLNLQETINAREKEIAVVKTELKAAKDSREELRLLLAEAKKNLADKEVEYRPKDVNIELQFKADQVTQELASLKLALKEKDARFLSSQNAWQTKEEVLKKKIVESSAVATELRSINERLQTSLEGVTEDFRISSSKVSALNAKYQVEQDEAKRVADSLSREVSDLKERLDVQSVNLFQSKKEASQLREECSRLNGRMEERGCQHEERITFAESRASSSLAQLATANRKVEELSASFSALETTLASTRDAAEQAANRTDVDLEITLKTLHDKIADLEIANAELENHANIILDRYMNCELSEKEKALISLVTAEERELQDDVMASKDNELRRRGSMIDNLKLKLTEAEKTVARHIKEKASAQKVIDNQPVDFQRFLPSSSPTMPIKAAEPPSMFIPEPTTGNFKAMDVDSDSEPENPLMSDLSLCPNEGKDKEESQQVLGAKRQRSRSPETIVGRNTSKRLTRNSAGGSSKVAGATAAVASTSSVSKKAGDGVAKTGKKKKKN